MADFTTVAIFPARSENTLGKKHGEINGKESRRQFHVGVALLSGESLVLFNVALTVEPTYNQPKMISCGNTRDCCFQFFCFPNYIFVFKSKALPISLRI